MKTSAPVISTLLVAVLALAVGCLSTVAKKDSEKTPSASTGGGGIIAYSVTSKNVTNQLFTIKANGSGKRQITNVAGRACGPDLSPDGSKFAYYNHFNELSWSLFTVDSNGDNPVQLTDVQNVWDARPRWSPEGKKIAFCRTYPQDNYREEIWVIDPDGINAHRVGTINGNCPFWSKDGERLLFTSWVGSANEIFEMNADGSNPTQLTNLKSEIYWPQWSPDNSRNVFQSNKDGDEEIYVMQSDGTNITQLTQNTAEDGDADWSPDGTRLVFVSKRDGHYELYLMNADGTGQARLTSTVLHAIQPDWKPAK
ncbi:MAG: hypothetical protein OEW00_05370 [candidate division Zixibacteria bacterium]|nr:hypothetical protein [candidate division Zixibacteria bacterium]